jgi:hypothetical protein
MRNPNIWSAVPVEQVGLHFGDGHHVDESASPMMREVAFSHLRPYFHEILRSTPQRSIGADVG